MRVTARLGSPPALKLPPGEQFLNRADRQAVLAGERLRTRPGEQRVLTLGHHQPGEGDRMADPLHRSHRTEIEVAAVHDDGVQFDLGGGVEEGSVASVKSGIVLQDPHGGLDRIQRRPTAHEHAPASFGGTAAAFHVGLVSLGGDIVGPTVDKDSR